MSPVEVWLVDGWNVLYGLTGRSAPRSKATPEALLSMLADVSAQVGCRILVVWDGHGPGGDPLVPTRGGSLPGRQAGASGGKIPVSSSVESVYSADQTADAVIERYLFEHRSQGRFVVVTDDGAMSQLAHNAGARVFSVMRFKEEIEALRQNRLEKADQSRVDAHGFNRPFDKLFDKFKGKS